jgi:ubiquinone/menaquinone biosynthesis C-methylase UbiE
VPTDGTAAVDLGAVRDSYDRVAADYADLLRDELAAMPVDRAVLGLFAELVSADGGGEVADLGCGPGRITAHLASLGLSARGIDLSPGMVAVARRDHPGLRFDVGTMTALDLPDRALAGAVAWYSVIHTPTDQVPAMLAELARVLRPGGRLLLAFQVGDEPSHLRRAYGHEVSLVVHRRTPELVTRLLAEAGLPVHIRTVREPEGWEKSPQAYLLARKLPADG